MGAIRVKGVAEEFLYPTICPNCLGTPVTGTVTLSREAGVPGVMTITFGHDWPHCEECVSFYSERAEFRKHRNYRAALWIIVGAVLSSFGAIVLMYNFGLEDMGRYKM